MSRVRFLGTVALAMDAQAATELLASVRAGMGDAARTRALVAAVAPARRVP